MNNCQKIINLIDSFYRASFLIPAALNMQHLAPIFDTLAYVLEDTRIDQIKLQQCLGELFAYQEQNDYLKIRQKVYYELREIIAEGIQ